MAARIAPQVSLTELVLRIGLTAAILSTSEVHLGLFTRDISMRRHEHRLWSS